eukprot:COSAG04_NODE_8128_length_1020_cov_1.014115_1_plen_154_part_00
MTLKVICHNATSPSSTEPPRPEIPALLKRKLTGEPGNALATASAAAAQSSAEATLQWMASTAAPREFSWRLPKMIALRSSSASFISSSDTSRIATCSCAQKAPSEKVTLTFIPACTQREAVSKPKPDAPPVITATPSVHIAPASMAKRKRGWV